MLRNKHFTCASRSVLLRASVVESLENRIVLDGDITLAPELVASLGSPRLRNPGAGIVFDPNVTPGENAPPVSGTIEAINFDGDASTSGFFHIPPDVIGAAGPNHVLNAVNTDIQWFTKAGTNQNTQRLGKNGVNAVGSFFQSLSPLSGLFDPKVLYDQYNNRFLVVALEQQDTANGAASNSSRLLMAVSDDSDPNGTWFFQSVNTNLTIGANSTWFDYPGLSISSSAIYVTGNMFTFGASGSYQGSRLWIFDKTGLYAGGTSTVTVYDPSTLAALPSQAFTLQPSHMFGTAPGTVGNYVSSSGWVDGSGNEFISIIRIDNPLSAPTFTNTFINVGNISSTFNNANASQLGTATTIESGDGRILNAVWRNNALYMANTISPTAGVDLGTATAHWYKFNSSTGSSTLADQGNVGAEDIAAGTRTYYPAVAVDNSNNLAIGFSASGPSVFPGAYYTGRLSTDAAGTVQSTGTLAAGLDFYIRTFSGTRNRWGDYTGMALDPADGSTFWVYNQYALTRGTIISGQDGRWGTRWGKFSFTGTISGLAYEDRDGSFSNNVGDVAMAGVTIYLDTNNNGVLDGGETSVVTTGSGYSFTGLIAATYNVREVIPSGYIRTEPASGVQTAVVASGATVTANFGNFPTTFTGTAGNDNYYVRASGSNTQIWVGTVPPTTPTYSIAKSLLPLVTFNTQGGDDSLVVDTSLGDPVPTAGISFNGGTQSTTAGDLLDIRGTGLADVFAINTPGSIVHGATAIAYATAESLKFSTSTLNASGNLSGLNLNVTGSTAAANFTGTQTLGTLTVATNALVNAASTTPSVIGINANSIVLNSGTLSASPNGTIRGVTKTKALSITGTGYLNLHNNDLIIDYTGGSSPFATVNNYVKNGLTLLGGAGLGIGSTEVDNQTIGGTMLGLVDNGDISGGITAISGAAAPADSLLIKYTWFGDATLDGMVDGADYALVDTGFTSGGTLTGWVFGNFDYGLTVDNGDYGLIDTGFIAQNTVL